MYTASEKLAIIRVEFIRAFAPVNFDWGFFWLFVSSLLAPGALHVV